jgi:release factor glutamine methyltransferase
MIKFLNCKIDLSKKVFEPRIETEYWVKKALSEIRNTKYEIRALDIFAGSGCIGIAILKNIKNSFVDFVDVSKEAIEQIKINLRLNKIGKRRYKIFHSNLFEKIKGKKYNFIFANPPYVALSRIKEVQKEVLKKEPKIALFAGKDGMYWIKKFLSQAKKYLKEDGKIFMEFDPKQKVEIEKILKKENFNFKFKKDQFKKYRWLIAWRKNF